MASGKGSIVSAILSFMLLVFQMTLWSLVLGYKNAQKKFGWKQGKQGPITKKFLEIYKFFS